MGGRPVAWSGVHVAGRSRASGRCAERARPLPPGPPAGYWKPQGPTVVNAAGVTVTQTLLTGYQTGNRTRQAEGQVFAARETLRVTEQNTLLNAATAYMNLLQTAA